MGELDVHPRVSILIPTYQHAKWLPEAIDCALAQTEPCEVIVVDDGSTDDTGTVLERYQDRIRVVTLPHGGPSVARNTGLEMARGEYVMFLDADDLIAPTKVAEQLAAFTGDVGWVLCDVRIEDESKGTVTLASRQYDYNPDTLGGWVEPLLRLRNIVPIMSPLVRKAALTGIRFDDTKVPEDWHFWHAVASAARVKYLPRELATYRHRRMGRSRLPKASRIVMKNVEMPLRLNLGCGTPNTRSWHPMQGFVNLDKSMGWRFEDGLKDFVDRSVRGITISHALMYVPEADWPSFFGEVARVLEDGGVVRITEDSACDSKSGRHGGWKGSQPAVTLTSPELVRGHLEAVGLVPHDVSRDSGRDGFASLRQAQHGDPPDVFFIEGQKVSAVLFAPHNDDESLFAAFTILRARPQVVVCYESSGDYGDPRVREAETREAMSLLGAAGVEQWAGGDLVTQMLAFDTRVRPTLVFAPSERASHPDHVTVARAAAIVFGERLTTYETYIHDEKVRSGRPVPFEPGWVSQKLRALSRYDSQISHPRANKFFTWDLLEYAGSPPPRLP